MAGGAFCFVCGSSVDWVTAKRAAGIIGVSDRRVRELIAEGRLPGTVKHAIPGYGIAVWKIPLESVAALLKLREHA